MNICDILVFTFAKISVTPGRSSEVAITFSRLLLKRGIKKTQFHTVAIVKYCRKGVEVFLFKSMPTLHFLAGKTAGKVAGNWFILILFIALLN